jgi:hypothetical protein
MSQEEAFGPELVLQPTGEAFFLTQEPVTIGTEEDNTIVVTDPEVSGHHATIAWDEESDTYVVQDMDSAAGTYVNELKIDAPQPLRHADVLRLGNTILDVRLEPEPDVADLAAAAAVAGVAAEEAASPAGEESITSSRKWILPAIIIAIVACFTVVCIVAMATALLGGGDNVPTVVVESPADGTQIVVGTQIILQATATGADDITLLELSVDGAIVATTTSPDGTGTNRLSVSKAWVFDTEGQHTVSAVAHTAADKVSDPASARVSAVADDGGVIPEATSTPKPGEPTNTPAPLPTQTPLASPTPEPSTTAAPPPQIDYFQASPASITAGDCVTLQWGKVDYATEAGIEPDVGGVATPGSEKVCPTETTTYILTATGPGGTTTASATVTVIGGLPDLTIDSIVFVPDPAVQGQNTEVQITIRNIGMGSAGAFNWDWQAGSEGVFDGRVRGLSAGESTVVTVSWIPADTSARLTTEARVDTDNEVVESDERNNQLTADVEVVGAPAEPETATVQSDPALDGFQANNGDGSTTEEIYVGNGDLVEPDGELVARGFMSFDLSDLPQGAVIEGVELRFYQGTIEGDPYGKLGNLLLEQVVYGDQLDASAFSTPALNSAALAKQTSPNSWYVLADAVIAEWVASDLAAGRSHTQLRLRFAPETDGDGEEDWIAVEPGGGVLGSSKSPQLTVTYLP